MLSPWTKSTTSIVSPFHNRRRGGGFNPSALFALSEPGVWFDPNDVANLSWRKNLLTFTEQFDNAAWTKLSSTVTPNSAIAPDGTLTADLLTVSGVANNLWAPFVDVAVGAVLTLSVWLKSSGAGGNAQIFLYNGGASAATTVALTNDWQRVSLSVTRGATTDGIRVASVMDSRSLSGAATSLLVWGAQLELGSVATDYQRISNVNADVIERFPSATLYQDSGGTIPVTTPGNPVGLMLDKSKGLLGPELVPNGNFSSGSTGWTVGASWSVTGGNAVVAVASSPTSIIPSTFSLVAGRYYKLIVDVTRITGALYIRVNADLIASANSSNTVNIIFAAPSSGSLEFLALGDFTGSIDNISVRELPGFHAISTGTARPTYGIVPLGGRRNLLTFTEEFDNAAWTKTAATATAGLLTENTGSGPHVCVQAFTYAAGDYTFAIDFKPNGRTWVAIQARSNASYFGLTGAGSLGNAVGTVTSRSITLLPDGYYRCVITFPATAGADNVTIYLASANGTVIYTGDGTSGVFLRRAQLETGSSATAYQRVGSAFDVTEAGVASLSYLSFDGVDDFMRTTTNHPFTYTGAISLFSGFEKIGTTKTYETLFAVGTGVGSNQARSMAFQVTDDGNNRLATDIWAPSGVRGSTTLISPVRAVAAFNINNWSTHRSGGSIIRLNGISETLTTYGSIEPPGLNASTMRIGVFDEIALPSSYLNGRLFSLIVRSASSDTVTIANTETWIGGKTPGFAVPTFVGVPTIGVA